MQLAELLDRAKSVTGSDAETARTIGQSDKRLSDWRNERRPCPITVQARICEAAGMDDAETMRYVWGVVRERLGKATSGAASGAAVWIGFTVGAFAPLAASHGDVLGATMYRPWRLTRDRG